jgi:hypothetical protein
MKHFRFTSIVSLVSSASSRRRIRLRRPYQRLVGARKRSTEELKFLFVGKQIE